MCFGADNEALLARTGPDRAAREHSFQGLANPCGLVVSSSHVGGERPLLALAPWDLCENKGPT